MSGQCLCGRPLVEGACDGCQASPARCQCEAHADPLAKLRAVEALDPDKRGEAAADALREVCEQGLDATTAAKVRDYLKRTKVLPVGSFDDIRRAARRADTEDQQSQSVAAKLVEIAEARYVFGVSDLGEPFALPREGPKVVAMLRGSRKSLRALLGREFFERTGKVPTQAALADALLVIEGMAQEAEESRLYLRSAEHGGALWLDLGDSTGRAVRIAADGWSIEDCAPVLFRRTALSGALPEPERGGALGDLWQWLNVREEDRPLIAAALVHALYSDQPHVVLALFGEHGTAKTTATKVIVLLLDPGPVPVRKPPRDAEAWVTAAAGSWVVALDNLSDIPPWLSDSLCRASTGDGDVRRRLYSDADLAVFAFRRCVVFNSIDAGTLAPDLADRTVPISLSLIDEADRTDEQTFWAGWQDAHPQLLGAMLDLAVSVMARLPYLTVHRLPRMADFARVLAAVDAALGTDALTRYVRQGAGLAAESLSGHAFATAMKERVIAEFEGTSADLLKLVTPERADWRPPKDWPPSSRAVTGMLRRLAPAFRKTGWVVDDLGSENHEKAIRWRILPPRQTEMARMDTRQYPPEPQDPRGGGDAGVGGGFPAPPTSAPRDIGAPVVAEPASPALALVMDKLGGVVIGLEGPSEGAVSAPDGDTGQCNACHESYESYWHAVACLGLESP